MTPSTDCSWRTRYRGWRLATADRELLEALGEREVLEL